MMSIPSNWHIAGNKLVREFKFDQFNQAIDFINKMANESERLNHHPNFCLKNYSHLIVEVYTHNVDAITEKDYDLAAKIENIY